MGRKKTKLFTWQKVLFGAVIFVIVISALNWVSSSQQHEQGTEQPSQQPYPSLVEGTFYTDPALTEEGTKVSVPYDFVNKNRLIFLDVPLGSPMKELEYQGRQIPLSLYKEGKYLPLIIVSTPLGRVIAGIRACEPCTSFSFHISDAKYLVCDICGTRWDIETLKGVSGSCVESPPPRLPVSVTDKVEVDISGMLFGS